jgi:hypothetical protein
LIETVLFRMRAHLLSRMLRNHIEIGLQVSTMPSSNQLQENCSHTRVTESVPEFLCGLVIKELSSAEFLILRGDNNQITLYKSWV